MYHQRLDVIPAASFPSIDVELRQPVEPLTQYIQCFWTANCENRRLLSLGEKLYPDAGTSLTFAIHHNSIEARYIHNACVLTHYWEPLTSYIGIRFRPGGAMALLGDSINEIQNTEVDFLDLPFQQCALRQKEGLHRLIDQLPTVADRQKIDAVQSWLLSLIQGSQKPDAKLPALLNQSSIHLLTPQQLAEHNGLSRRTLERRFRKYLGFTPNQIHSFAQINKARRALITTPDSLSAIALDCGYFDQAHFTNAFHQHTTETPRQYRLRKLSQISN